MIAVQLKQHRLHLTQVPQQVWPGNFDLPQPHKDPPRRMPLLAGPRLILL